MTNNFSLKATFGDLELIQATDPLRVVLDSGPEQVRFILNILKSVGANTGRHKTASTLHRYFEERRVQCNNVFTQCCRRHFTVGRDKNMPKILDLLNLLDRLRSDGSRHMDSVETEIVRDMLKKIWAGCELFFGSPHDRNKGWLCAD